jgi:hypothetical protein
MDTTNSSIKGKAYEYACVLALQEIVSPIREIELEENGSLAIARSRYENDILDTERSEMLLSAKSGIETIIEMEPKIVEDGTDTLTVSLQPDNVAKALGDIRDVLIIRRDIQWEIGVSVKHNHAALKHSRLSNDIDFGDKWVGVPCSQTYFDDILPIFTLLTELKTENKLWRDLDNKEDDIYIPLLTAFMNEFNRLNSANNIVADLIRYLLGSNGKDYYKLIHHSNHTTTIIPFNLYGTLNQATTTTRPTIMLPAISLPTRIIELAFKDNSKTTLILSMDNGWQISFRIHNASSEVEASLKFDIQLVGQPTDLFYLDREW